ncbi:MAG: LLM class flavin-dependent oxidoreductase [Pseudomonadota bacterium]|nr:LLM class flavin-dependent oxidoreductase [Pseudomonadota bacterium]
MHVGMCSIFQNPGNAISDQLVYSNEVKLAEFAEPLGFESIWTVEHHFTNYTMCPDPMQFLTYMAAKTKTIKLGSMVVVLPWHDPIRIAEQISMLDTLSNGRLILGLGRGAGRIEFDAFRQDMEDSRQRFVESAECVLHGLENGVCQYEGKFVIQPKAAIRPLPSASFKGRTYAAAVSPESIEIMAKLGIGLLVIPQKPWDQVEREIDNYNKIYKKLNNQDPPAPLLAGWTICHANKNTAKKLAEKYIGGYWQTVLDHYSFNTDHLKNQKGYEYYGKFAESMKKTGINGAIEFFMGLQTWGTPEECYHKIEKNCARIGAEAYIGVFSFAGMPFEIAQANIQLFAQEVLPKLKAKSIIGNIDWAA